MKREVCMLRNIAMVACVVLFLCGCDDSHFNNAPATPEEQPSENAGPAVSKISLDGSYDLVSVSFDSDSSANSTTCVTITQDAKDIQGSTSGETWVQRLKISAGYLDIISETRFVFYYKIADSSNRAFEVASLKEAFQTGSYEYAGDVILFHPENSGGLADAAESEYIVTEEEGLIVLTAKQTLVDGNRFVRIELE